MGFCDSDVYTTYNNGYRLTCEYGYSYEYQDCCYVVNNSNGLLWLWVMLSFAVVMVVVVVVYKKFCRGGSSGGRSSLYDASAYMANA